MPSVRLYSPFPFVAAMSTFFFASFAAWPATFRVATYNVEGYLEVATPSRPAKSADSRTKVRESIRALAPDVLALQEIGGTNALLELRDSLKQEGLDLAFWELVDGADTNINVAVLSRFPFAARRPHTRENFLLGGRRFQLSRGIAEVDVQVNSGYKFTLIAAHLKSRRLVPQADEAELRLEEAKILREKIDLRLAADPEANLVVLGDLNDTQDSASTKMILGRGKAKLVDTRPAERAGEAESSSDPQRTVRRVTWTHFYAKDDVYSRIDFILISPGMANEWVRQETYALTLPDWGVASDHRPILATFVSEDR
jgi:endonuclease/exonuclease/phosphatase family metal-dependent hydrolase